MSCFTLYYTASLHLVISSYMVWFFSFFCYSVSHTQSSRPGDRVTSMNIIISSGSSSRVPSQLFHPSSSWGLVWARQRLQVCRMCVPGLVLTMAKDNRTIAFPVKLQQKKSKYCGETCWTTKTGQSIRLWIQTKFKTASGADRSQTWLDLSSNGSFHLRWWWFWRQADVRGLWNSLSLILLSSFL